MRENRRSIFIVRDDRLGDFDVFKNFSTSHMELTFSFAYIKFLLSFNAVNNRINKANSISESSKMQISKKTPYVATW